MKVAVVLTVAQLGFQILARPEKHQIQTLPAYGTDQPFHEWMGKWHIGGGFDFLPSEDPKIPLPLVETV